MKTINCFTPYDVRGKLGTDLNSDVAYRVGRSFGKFLNAKTVVIGGDARETSPELKQSCANGLMDEGINVIDLGLTGTEEIYFATLHLGACGGVEVTASHNPIDYNGMKFVGKGSSPISINSGLNEIKLLAETEDYSKAKVVRGEYSQHNIYDDYAAHLLSYVDVERITPLKIVVNSGNGAAGHVIDKLQGQFVLLNVPIEFVKINHEPDSSFPNGIPNPLLPENRTDTITAITQHKADFGVAWDGDFDRCFLFDEKGNFIEGYYIVGLLAEFFLKKFPNEKIVYEPRLTWNTEEVVGSLGGHAVISKTGHAFMKETMRHEGALYGGEMSAHHYFRDFGYCDSGMIPWLIVAQMICDRKTPLSALVNDRVALFPVSGETNYKVINPQESINRVLDYYQSQSKKVETLDGISVDMGDWRFNLRMSNTEPVIRLNVESRGDRFLTDSKQDEIASLLCES